MKWKTIPHGIRKSFIKRIANEVRKELVADFIRNNPPVFKVGDVVILPTTTQRLFGDWEVFDPTFLRQALSKGLPESAIVANVYPNTSWLEQKWEGHYGISERVEDCQTESAVRQRLIDLATKYRTAIYGGRFDKHGIWIGNTELKPYDHKPVYWSCSLNGVSFTWGVPADFLTGYTPTFSI